MIESKKYPHTPYCPWSMSVGSGDRVLTSMNSFVGKRIIVTEKRDGENTTLLNDHLHARSLSSANHPSRNWAKAKHGQIKHLIPDNWRISCENLFAKHSLAYTNLQSYLEGISIWNDKNICIHWDETKEWFNLLNIPTVPVLYDGTYNEELIKRLYTTEDINTKEGYVIRVAAEFHYDDFKDNVCKFVRKNHIQTDQHWMFSRIIPNKLKK